MPLHPIFDFLVPQVTTRTFERFLDADDDYPNPFMIQRPSCPAVHRKHSSSVVTSNKNKFKICLDVQPFTAEELTVKSLDNNMIQVEGKHDERQDEHGLIFRHFVRKYTLPKGHDTKHVTSTLSSGGILTIVSRKRKNKCEEIPIKLTGTSEGDALNEIDPETKNEKKPEEQKN